jgi:hypothetical protein
MVTVPTFGFGIRPRGPSTFTEASDHAHHVGGGDATVEIDLALLHLLGQVFAPDNVGTGFAGLIGLGAFGEHRDARGAAGAVGERNHAADHLVGMTRIDAQIHRDFDGLVEFRLCAALDQLHRLFQRILLLRIDAFASFDGTFSDFGHDQVLTSMPIERAEPMIICMAASTSFAFRSFILAWAIVRT